MQIGRTSNPALNKNTFSRFGSLTGAGGRMMTLNGTVNKTVFMLLIVLLGATFTWKLFFDTFNADKVLPWMIGGGIGGFILSLVTVFKRTWAPYTVPLYALLEGLFLGGLSALFETRFPGIVMQAVCLTFCTLFALLLAYKSKIIKPTENFKLGVIAATGGVGLVYLISFILSFFGIRMSFIHESGLIGIGFSVLVIVIAALNLVLDFDFIEQGVNSGAPKYMEYYAAFGLLVTLIWLYIEFLRLLAKLNSRK